jgi:hypothetical protein
MRPSLFKADKHIGIIALVGKDGAEPDRFGNEYTKRRARSRRAVQAFFGDPSGIPIGCGFKPEAQGVKKAKPRRYPRYLTIRAYPPRFVRNALPNSLPAHALVKCAYGADSRR